MVSPNDITPPAIDITTPFADQCFSGGSTISSTGKFTDDPGLSRGTIKITYASNQTVAESFKDHVLNSASKCVKIKINP